MSPGINYKKKRSEEGRAAVGALSSAWRNECWIYSNPGDDDLREQSGRYPSGWLALLNALNVALRQVLGCDFGRLHPPPDICPDQRHDPAGVERLGSRLMLPLIRMERSRLAPSYRVSTVSHQSRRRLSGESVLCSFLFYIENNNARHFLC